MPGRKAPGISGKPLFSGSREDWLPKERGSANPGVQLLKRHFKGHHLTRAQAIKAKCADCTSYYADGRKDCENNLCPLHDWMPYRKKSKGVDSKEVSE